jgi:dihydroxyacid dehydratase/phosphogluconate dehydratase
VNHFHAAGGLGFMIGELLDAGLLHEDVRTIAGDGLANTVTEPKAARRPRRMGRGRARNAERQDPAPGQRSLPRPAG